MTVLDKRESSDEDSNKSRKKIRFSGCLNGENPRRAWLTDKTLAKPPTKIRYFGEMVNNHDIPSAVLTLRKPPEEYIEDDSIPLSPLLNLGNTCFLNSVLYTLRFAPLFLHKLHHLNIDSAAFVKNFYTGKSNTERNTYSLGRSFVKTGLWNTKETSFGTDYTELKIHMAIDKLHYVYKLLTDNEHKCSSSHVEPLEPTIFLHALREVNPIFEGNQQHDAHELLVCVLDIIREVCQVLYHQNLTIESPPNSTDSSSSNPLFKAFKSITKSLKFKKSPQNEKEMESSHKDTDALNEQVRSDDSSFVEDDERPPAVNVYDRPNTIFDDFQGVSVLCTTCSECEQVTEMKETFCDICVPIEITDTCGDVDEINNLYHSMILTEEHLVGSNKYWCDKCTRYNEAKRAVKYQRLPRLLTLHFKRFSTNYGSRVCKVNDYMPTSFTLYCFCEECSKIKKPRDRPHYYELYSIIMHLGSTIASGHYVTYVKTFDETAFNSFDDSSDVCYPSSSYAASTTATATTNTNTAVTTVITPTTNIGSSATVASNVIADVAGNLGAVVGSTTFKPQHSSSSSSSLSRMCSFSYASNNEHKLMQLLKKHKPLKSSSSPGDCTTADKLEVLRAAAAVQHNINRCKAIECCSVRFSGHHHPPSSTSIYSSSSGYRSASSSCASSSSGNGEAVWLECDDECVRVISMEELTDMLGPSTKNCTATPYLLFYARKTSRVS